MSMTASTLPRSLDPVSGVLVQSGCNTAKTSAVLISSTGMSRIGPAYGIDTLVLAGVHTSGVVLSIVRHAGDLDYRLVVVRDCCADPDAEVHAMLLDTVIARQAAIVTTAELAGALPGRSS
jgi:nicotinamidase-related amidase